MSLEETPKKRRGPQQKMQNNRLRLNLQQKMFCEAYVAMGPNARYVKAAAKVGYVNPRDAGVKLIAKPEVLAYIEELRRSARLRNNIEIDDIISEYAKIAFFDIREMYDPETGELKAVKDWDDIAGAAIGSVSVDTRFSQVEGVTITTAKIAPRDKLIALNGLRDMLGYKEREKKVIKDGAGNIIGTEETERIPVQAKVIFEDHSGKAGLTNGDSKQV